MEKLEQSNGKKQLIKMKSFKDSLNKVGAKEAEHKGLLSGKNPTNFKKKETKKKKKTIKPAKCQKTSVIVNFFQKKKNDFNSFF